MATTLREAHDRHAQRLGRGGLVAGRRVPPGDPRDDLEIFDRVGGGDSFASGLIYGLLAGKGPQWAWSAGPRTARSAMTTPGDTSMVTLDEVEAAMRARTVRAVR